MPICLFCGAEISKNVVLNEEGTLGRCCTLCGSFYDPTVFRKVLEEKSATNSSSLSEEPNPPAEEKSASLAKYHRLLEEDSFAEPIKETIPSCAENVSASVEIKNSTSGGMKELPAEVRASFEKQGVPSSVMDIGATGGLNLTNFDFDNNHKGFQARVENLGFKKAYMVTLPLNRTGIYYCTIAQFLIWCHIRAERINSSFCEKCGLIFHKKEISRYITEEQAKENFDSSLLDLDFYRQLEDIYGRENDKKENGSTFYSYARVRKELLKKSAKGDYDLFLLLLASPKFNGTLSGEDQVYVYLPEPLYKTEGHVGRNLKFCVRKNV